ncbi:MAG: TlyA family RNA methyltransferase [Firmicutes bacterium]|nr:TlyA family RNA methyltransferase [Bacillota bacterium]
MAKKRAEKKRADIYLTEVKAAESREQARRLIEEGRVFVNGKPISKPASLVEEGSHISVVEKLPYVSRGGVKLEKAIHDFKIDVRGKTAIDIGASTGGFTDCLLKHGARHVTAIDVGYGQLAWQLRSDPRVTVLERTNIRYIDPALLPSLADLITIDVSFISLEKIHDSVSKLLKPTGELIALVKPQFEVGKERVGKKGVVRSAEAHKDVLKRIWEFYERQGMFIKGLTFSPIKGPEGNIEFLLYASRMNESTSLKDREAIIDEVVETAHRQAK